MIINLISKMIKLNLKVNLENNQLKEKIHLNVKINFYKKIRLNIPKP
jgi:hypothetical protein